MKKFYITKTNFISSLKCSKTLWMNKHKPNLKEDLSFFNELLIDNGHLVGELSKKYNWFQPSFEVKYKSVSKALAQTKTILKNKKIKFIFEGTFTHNYNGEDTLVKVDVLEKNFDGTYNLIEVKSSSSVKKEQIQDISFQKWVLQKNGLKIKDCYIMHLNREFRINDKRSKEELFSIELVNESVEKQYVLVETILDERINELQLKKEPQKILGGHCKNPSCPYKSHCWKNESKTSVYRLSRISQKNLIHFNNEGIKNIEDIPDEYPLTHFQRIQRECAKNDSMFVNKDLLEDTLSTLKYPLFYLDFEALNNPIPKFKGIKPNGFLTYQISIHKQDVSGYVNHNDYLHTRKTDPREELSKFLMTHLETKGSIIVWNKSFEESRIRDLINFFPKYKEQLQSIINRMWDLADIFKNPMIYHSDFMGSYSLKNVIPNLVPEVNYSNLTVSDGGLSQFYYKNLMNGAYKGFERKRIIKELRKYNTLDTYSMILCLDKVLQILENTDNSKLIA